MYREIVLSNVTFTSGPATGVSSSDSLNELAEPRLWSFGAAGGPTAKKLDNTEYEDRESIENLNNEAILTLS
jgi:hypothetical protein